MALIRDLLARDDERKRIEAENAPDRPPDGYIWVSGAKMGYWNAPAQVIEFRKPVKRRRAA
tara:strand:- start:602 stop:784 length:183 start_codon:yes stop_codon:yes gene_type:complete